MPKELGAIWYEIPGTKIDVFTLDGQNRNLKTG